MRAIRPLSPALLGLLALVASCGTGGTGNPFLFPALELAAGPQDPAYVARRGATELAVKGGFDQILAEIPQGGGPALDAAFDAAGVPAGDRPARILQLQGDAATYAATPGALVSAMMVWGG